MVISDFAIRRPIITITAMVALTLFGLFALSVLETDEFPDVQEPIVTVGIPYPGASPETVEKEVLDPVEEAIASISGVDEIRGSAEDGFAFVVVRFQYEKALPEATQDIRDAISGIRNDLPVEMEEPLIRKFSQTDRPVVSLALSSTVLSPRELTRIADPGITREIRSLTGVADVSIAGKRERELTIELRPGALQASGVSVGQVVQAVQLQNLAAPVGRLETALEERSIRLRGRLEGPEEFAKLVVLERNGRLVRLGDVATVQDGAEEERTLALYDGREAVGIDIKKAKGYSTTQVTARVIERIEQIRLTLPANVTLDVIRNTGTKVEASVTEVKVALFEGALLTVLVVFLFLNSWRSTVITGLALPVSVIASFVAVWAFDFTLNTMSLLGLSLAIGILIDDAIVVRENIVRHVAMGKDHFTAAHDGTNEIGLAVAATTFSILAVFIPVAFLPGVSGQWFKPFALTIACSVSVSLLVSFSLDPMLSAYWADPHLPPERRAWITRLLDQFNDWFNRQAQRYKRLIAWALDHRLAVVGLSLASFAIALAMPALGLVGVGFMPEDDRSEMFIQLEAPPGSNLEYLRRRTADALAVMETVPEVTHTYATLGTGLTGAVDVGTITVLLVPKLERTRSVQDIAGAVRPALGRVGGVTLSVRDTDWGGSQKLLQLNVRGPDVTALNEVAERILVEARQVPDVVDLGLSTKGQKPEITVEIDRGLAGALGITVGQIVQSLRPAFAGIDAGDWIDPSGETRDVMIRLAPEARTRITDLQQLPLVVAAAGGIRSVPLGQVARIEHGLGPAVINHLNRDPVITVGWNIAGRSPGEVTADVTARIAGLPLPEGVTITEGAMAEQQTEVFTKIFQALGLAILLMYLILAMQFGSFVDPLAIMMSLPLSLIGVMLALSITGLTINIMSLIGVILLMGIVAKNAILVIDFAKWARERDALPLREALIEAGAIRLRPILMTTFALIAGMLPIALGRGEGAQFRSPLGVAVIGGVITSTLLTLVAIPTFYEILHEGREAALRGVSRLFRAARRSAAGEAATEVE